MHGDRHCSAQVHCQLLQEGFLHVNVGYSFELGSQSLSLLFSAANIDTRLSMYAAIFL